MAKKTDKQYEIKIIRGTRIKDVKNDGASKSVEPGEVLKSPKDISREDAILLLRIGKATPADDPNFKNLKTAVKKPDESR